MYPVQTYARLRQFGVWAALVTERELVQEFPESYTSLQNKLIQWTLESRTQSVPRGGSTFNLFDFRVKFSHKK
jgi:hypothetical protein